jgi:SAM-dependent methyltransferase
MTCRLCNSKELYKFLDLGFTPPADEFRRQEALAESVVFYPLDVYMCEDCGLAQLGYVVSPAVLYRHDYPYESSTTNTGKKHFHLFAAEVVNEFNLNKNDLVVDIGSNVGVLLQGFKIKGTKVLGIDPAANIVRIAEKRGIETWNDFFSIDVAQKIVKEKGTASIVTGTNVFAHINDLHAFMSAVRYLLNKKGVLIIEAPHFLHLLKNLEYDTIYHEHLSYISIEPLVPFLKSFDMEIIKIEQKDIHGGSIRIFISKSKNYPIQKSVDNILKLEKKSGLRKKSTLTNFAKKVEKNRADLMWMLRKLKHDGKRIVAVSAPAKGMTLLNYCKIGRETLDYVTEKSSLKIGRYTPGDHIPVHGDSKLLEDMPDFALLLAWNFSKEIIENLHEYKKRGGKFIIPIPNPVII